MKTASITTLASLAALPLLLACESQPDPVGYGLRAMSFASSEWSAPVNLGSTINTTFNEQDRVGLVRSTYGSPAGRARTARGKRPRTSDRSSTRLPARPDRDSRSTVTSSSSRALALVDRDSAIYTSHSERMRRTISPGDRRWVWGQTSTRRRARRARSIRRARRTGQATSISIGRHRAGRRISILRPLRGMVRLAGPRY